MNTGQPQEKPTTKLDQSEIQRELLNKVLKTVEEGFARADARFDAVEANQELQGGQVLDIGKRLTSAEERLGKIEERQNAGSIRVKEESSVNLKQDAAIAQVIENQDALAKEFSALKTESAAQTAMLTKLTDGASKLFANPLVRSIATAAGAAILTWLTSKGLR